MGWIATIIAAAAIAAICTALALSGVSLCPCSTGFRPTPTPTARLIQRAPLASCHNVPSPNLTGWS